MFREKRSLLMTGKMRYHNVDFGWSWFLKFSFLSKIYSYVFRNKCYRDTTLSLRSLRYGPIRKSVLSLKWSLAKSPWNRSYVLHLYLKEKAKFLLAHNRYRNEIRFWKQKIKFKTNWKHTSNANYSTQNKSYTTTNRHEHQTSKFWIYIKRYIFKTYQMLRILSSLSNWCSTFLVFSAVSKSFSILLWLLKWKQKYHY